VPGLKETRIVFPIELARKGYTSDYIATARFTICLSKAGGYRRTDSMLRANLATGSCTTLPRLHYLPMKPSEHSKTLSPNRRSMKRPSRFAHPRVPAAQPSPECSRHDKRILLVDDDFTVRDSLNDVLVAEGFVVMPAENGQQALDLANESPVDLLLLDLNMPVKNGWDTFEQFTREHPLIPVIIATARPNQLFTALSAGAGALLEKPMDIPTLLQTIEKLLAEPADLQLARLAGKHTDLLYKPAVGGLPQSHQAKHR